MKISIGYFSIFFILLGNFQVSQDSGDLMNNSFSTSQNYQTADSLLALAHQYIRLDIDIAKLYNEQGYQLIKERDYKKGKINYFLNKSQIAYYNDEYVKTMTLADSAKNIIDSENDVIEIARYFYIKGSTHFCLGEYMKAIESIKKSIKVRNLLGDNQGIAMCNNFMGKIYLQQNNLENANHYFILALRQNKKIDNDIGRGYVLINLGKLKEEQDSLNAAYSLFQEAHKLFLKNGELRGIAFTLTRTAKIEAIRGNASNALSSLEDAENIYIKLNEKYGLIMTYIQMSIVYLETNNLNLAISTAEKANQLATQIKNEPLIAESLLQLSNGYKTTKNYKKALYYLEEYEKLNKKLISWEQNKKIADLEFQSELTIKEKNIELLEQVNKLKQNHNYLLIAAVVFLLLVSTGAILFFKMKNNDLLQKKELLEKRNKVVEFENKIHEQNKKIYENDLELKNKELASKALALVQLNETLKKIGNNINDTDQDNEQIDPRIAKKIMIDIQMASHGNMWKEFDTAFNNVYNDFYDKLFKICPNLSASEIKLAALLKLNLTTKEIAALTFKSESAIKTARHRLRQKLNIGNEGSLVSFLLKL